MARLIITGPVKKLEIIEKENRLRAKNYGLTMKISDEIVESQAVVIEKMKAVESLEELEQFSNDDRKQVKVMYLKLHKKLTDLAVLNADVD